MTSLSVPAFLTMASRPLSITLPWSGRSGSASTSTVACWPALMKTTSCSPTSMRTSISSSEPRTRTTSSAKSEPRTRSPTRWLTASTVPSTGALSVAQRQAVLRLGEAGARHRRRGSWPPAARPRRCARRRRACARSAALPAPRSASGLHAPGVGLELVQVRVGARGRRRRSRRTASAAGRRATGSARCRSARGTCPSSPPSRCRP